MAAEAKKLITLKDTADLKSTVKSKKWQTDDSKTFEDEFFTGKCAASKGAERNVK